VSIKNLKLPGIILFLLLSAQAFAQRLNGVVLDKATGTPIPGAIVKRATTFIQLTNHNGYFTLANPHFGDTLKITSLGYLPYNLMLGMPRGDTIRVYLISSSTMLNNVDIHAKRDPRIDSITNRREFAAAFTYKAPTIKDAFVKVDPYEYVPNNYIMAQNSTTSILNLNVLSAIGLFGKNKSPDSKLHQLVINKEKLDYVDQRFTRQKVADVTKLKGDSLENFIYLYRPPAEMLRAMTDYDLLVYIKKNNEEYRSGKTKTPVIK